MKEKNMTEFEGFETLPHAGIIAVVGRTNAGKSTLVNRIIGEKISIVSPVVQTTRNVVRGVLTNDNGQMVLVDTPGLHKSKSTLCTIMNKRARAAAEGVDAVMVVFDGAKEPHLEDEGWMRRLLHSEVPCFFVLNKSDRGSRAKVFRDMWQSLCAEQKDAEEKCAEPKWFGVSAATGEGIDALVAESFEILPAGPMLFDADTLSDYPQKLAIADVIREKFFLALDDELPHSIGIKVDRIDTHKQNGKMMVSATVYVQRAGHKGIVIGAKGKTLRTIQAQAEKDLAAIYETPVKLDLWIKVEPGWDQNVNLLKQMGYM